MLYPVGWIVALAIVWTLGVAAVILTQVPQTAWWLRCPVLKPDGCFTCDIPVNLAAVASPVIGKRLANSVPRHGGRGWLAANTLTGSFLKETSAIVRARPPFEHKSKPSQHSCAGAVVSRLCSGASVSDSAEEDPGMFSPQPPAPAAEAAFRGFRGRPLPGGTGHARTLLSGRRPGWMP